MTGALLAGLVAGYGIAIPVGAVGAYLVTLAARCRRSVAVGAALGVATADGGYALLAVVGGHAVADAVEPVATPLRWTSAAVLVAIAVTIAGSAVADHRRHARGNTAPPTRATPTTPGGGYAVLLAVTCLNPTTLTYFAALVLGDGLVLGDRAGQADPCRSVVFVAAAFAASASWQLALVAAGSALGRIVSGPQGRLMTAVVSSTMVIGLAANTALSV
ncbi:LysE family transporter [Prauserella alba]|uniref:LysE family transporter n=1 Tax=Prauserella alba TaxID=176898 RepID=A0ABP4G224_9PSEU|nr:LysE family transporter [Prauserella alba]MCP2182315.1 Arginine exporter protein ArgO [Prauserella alba]